MKKTVPTFCRVCEPSCGLLAEVEDERLLRLRPDDEHPVTRGFACHKGLGFTDVHHDPDRLNVPLSRTNARTTAGEFRERSWDEVLPELAAALRGIQQQHGPAAIAGYVGNPTAFNALGARRSRRSSRSWAASACSARARRTAPTSLPAARPCSAPARCTPCRTSSTRTTRSSSERTRRSLT
ncbi:MAG: molybdopterin-dependent oxidoreductase [Sandaracinaceae bacterium]|nr:molybdopterin-dependent oxidoreductase [Sandaracinaceae bacterium]